jgi:hypothetical protein
MCLFVALTVWRPAVAQVQTKRIFNLVALGEDVEDVEDVIKRLGKPRPPIHKNRLRWFNKGPGDILAVVVHEGKIASVAAGYSKPSWIKYRRVQSILARKYGKPEVLDYYPSYADDDSGKSLAIRAEQGRGFRRWSAGIYSIDLV